MNPSLRERTNECGKRKQEPRVMVSSSKATKQLPNSFQNLPCLPSYTWSYLLTLDHLSLCRHTILWDRYIQLPHLQPWESGLTADEARRVYFNTFLVSFKTLPRKGSIPQIHQPKCCIIVSGKLPYLLQAFSSNSINFQALQRRENTI